MVRILTLLLFVVGCGFSADVRDPKADPTVDARTSGVDPPTDAGTPAADAAPPDAPCRRGEDDCKGPKPPGP